MVVAVVEVVVVVVAEEAVSKQPRERANEQHAADAAGLAIYLSS